LGKIGHGFSLPLDSCRDVGRCVFNQVYRPKTVVASGTKARFDAVNRSAESALFNWISLRKQFVSTQLLRFSLLDGRKSVFAPAQNHTIRMPKAVK
jgi:hypothetical protein